jgi:hypothetical protein
MNDSCKELVNMGKLAARTQNGTGRISAQGFAEKRGSAARQNGVQATHRIDMNSSKPTAGAYSYAEIEADFRGHHHMNAAQRRGPYEHYHLVYRYGYDLGTDMRYCDADWSTVEQAARPRWEERNPGTWEQFKETIQYAWDTARGRRGYNC